MMRKLAKCHTCTFSFTKILPKESIFFHHLPCRIEVLQRNIFQKVNLIVQLILDGYDFIINHTEYNVFVLR